MNLRIHNILPQTRVNGPGLRTGIWVQGCTLGCPGCFNPLTHTKSGQPRSIDRVWELIQVQGEAIEGITVSGGEPLQQFDAVVSLLERVHRESSLSVLLFTGFHWHEIERMPNHRRLLDLVDVIVAGRYDQSQRVGSGLLGSANQTFHFLTDRYSAADLEAVPASEITIDSEGNLQISGVDPPRLVA